MNQHRRIQELLAVYRDLTDSERRDVEQHVATCAECARTLAAYRAMDRRLAELNAQDRTLSAPLQPNARLQKAFKAGETTRPWWLRWMTPIPGFLRQVTGVAALLVLTAGLILIFGESTARPGEGPNVTLTATGGSFQAFATSVVEPEVIATSEPITVTEAAQEPLSALPTSALVSSEKAFTVCLASEPQTLLWSEGALVTEAVLEAVQEPAIELLNYEYAPNLVEKLPSYEDGDASLYEVTIAEGDSFVDADTQRVLTLTQGMTESFALAQLEGDPFVVQQWDGSPLPTVQQSAQWRFVEGLTWEDGSPVTAEDSVFAFSRSLDPEYHGDDKQVSERTAAYEAVDERTVRWIGVPGHRDDAFFINIWNPQPSHLYGTLSWTEIQGEERANRAPLSYGPFKIDEWVAGEAITMSRNPYYFRGEPPLDAVTFRFVEANQMIAQIAAGDCDLGFQDAGFDGNLPLLHGFEEQGLLKVLSVPSTTFEHLDFNLLPAEGYSGAAATLRDNEGGLLFQNPEFRRAVAYCLDRQAIVDATLNGGGAVQHSYTSSGHPYYPGDEALSIYEFDAARGRALLADLGWTDTDGDGLLDDGTGAVLAFNYATRANPLREAVTETLQTQLRENCGIEVRVEAMGSEFFAEGPEGPIFGRTYDVAEFAWLVNGEPPCNLYLSTLIPNEVNGWEASNSIGFSNPDFDSACEAALSDIEPDEKVARHTEAMAIWTEQLPSIPLFARFKITVVRPDVEGVILDPSNASELWNIENFDVTP